MQIRGTDGWIHGQIDVTATDGDAHKTTGLTDECSTTNKLAGWMA